MTDAPISKSEREQSGGPGCQPVLGEWCLYVGNRFTGIVVRPDEKYPSMFRIYRPGQPPSDMVNLTRAKDAASISARIGGREVFYWKYRERRPEGARAPVLADPEGSAMTDLLGRPSPNAEAALPTFDQWRKTHQSSSPPVSDDPEPAQ